MTQRKKKTSPAAKVFGAQSRMMRERLGWTMKDLEKRVPYTESMIAKVERGERVPKPPYVVAVDEALAAQGLLMEAAKLLWEDGPPEWTQEYLELEADALALHVYSTHILHGLLQTEDFTRAVFQSLRPSLDEEEVERAVQRRLATQQLLYRKPAPRLAFVLEEAVLRKMIGGREVWEGQLRHLLKCAALHNVQLQVMPNSRETNAGVDGPMVLLETPNHCIVGYVEGQRGSYFLSDPEDISELNHVYGTIQSQALDPEASVAFIERLLAGEL
ncbi:helix-turn-helix transcriptional regulator [Streptomyces sp. Rer75]|uniref:helix-turn-helix domain-containing protein n=1 Tax=Streptomyces sp. Rer75 TaxID=2750011 RepID=UPI0015CFD4E0|nr:helix-turn-helix transcriptional regulator [Streptomyces sp. Rer75]QLH24292.1 helix-turn-helix domain-containing protein [Streptomyces sp. Rer75]